MSDPQAQGRELIGNITGFFFFPPGPVLSQALDQPGSGLNVTLAGLELPM